MSRQRFLWIAPAAACAVFLFASSLQAQGPIAKRKARQQARIAAGVASGQLTARETARIERHESALNREEARMRARNGGTLTPRERRRINRQQDRLSREIYREKHDGQTR